jgi:hypothetical protein
MALGFFTSDPQEALLSPDTIAARRKLNERIRAGTMADKPIKHWTQGAAKLAWALAANAREGRLDKTEKAARAKSNEIIASLLGGGGSAPAASPGAAPVSALPSAAPGAVAASIDPDAAPSAPMNGVAMPSGVNPPQTTFNGMPGPYDFAGKTKVAMPGVILSPEDLDVGARTLLTEAGNQGEKGLAAVAAVLKNRATAGNPTWGKSISDAALARNQFEPWNYANTGKPNDPTRIDPTSTRYAMAKNILQGVATGAIPDPTGGATHFYAPRAQAALGRPAPSWARGKQGMDIGDHRFYNLGGGSAPAVPQNMASAGPSGAFAPNMVSVPAPQPSGATPRPVATAPSQAGNNNAALMAAMSNPWVSAEIKKNPLIGTLLAKRFGQDPQQRVLNMQILQNKAQTSSPDFMQKMAASRRANNGDFGVTPVYGVTPDGKPAIGQLNKRGGIRWVDSQGNRIAQPVKTIDLGTSVRQIGAKTGQPVGPDMPKDIAGAKAQAAIGAQRGKDVAAAQADYAKATDAINSIDALMRDQGLGNVTGPIMGRLPNIRGDANRAQARIDQIKGQTFLQAYQQLRGGGQITEVEGKKAEAAIARLSQSQTTKDFKAALQDLRSIIEVGRSRIPGAASLGASGAGGKKSQPVVINGVKITPMD